MECVLEPTRQDVITRYEAVKSIPNLDMELVLPSVAKASFYTTSTFTTIAVLV
jgi:hypothetical protein